MQDTHELTQADLAQFIGSTCLYRFALTGLRYTEGVHHVAEKGGAVWLIADIAAYQHDPAIRAEPFQHWKLSVADDRTARLACENGNGKPILVRKIDYTEFPLEEIAFFLTDNVLMLPGEY
ncbi:DUF6876 family protein [Nitratireductor sp. XY-223]|uniref:DUF6876 family protein n=1 Tax=Nitratireductor sp. XY-223 TaxID=2561926 RepID=UPI0010AA39EA|nr:DUF6876 family protein [Nitratireductor sp. XY-223]